MVKTHADKIREAVLELGIASPREIMDWVKVHYPEDPVNPKSYRADIIGCSINHNSSKYYPSTPKFLWFIEESKKYRMANESDPDYDESETPNPIEIREESEIIDGIHVSELSPTSKLHLPKEIRELLNVEPGDKIGFIIKDNDAVELRKAHVKLTFE